MAPRGNGGGERGTEREKGGVGEGVAARETGNRSINLVLTMGVQRGRSKEQRDHHRQMTRRSHDP